MNQYVFWLGTNPELSRLELLNVLARLPLPYRVIRSHTRYITISSKNKLDGNFINRLGGVDRIGKVIRQKSIGWTATELSQVLSPTDKKMMAGLSKFNLPKLDLMKLAKEMKTISRGKGIRLNYLAPTGGKERLNAAQVIFNKLCQPPNAELTIWTDDKQFYLARTIQVQDIQAYERRDTQRPRRDPRIGLLPPKLAQIMLNLVPDLQDLAVVYDPFCGMGTILQEGWLMGMEMVGSDASSAMVEASKENMRWLADSFTVEAKLKPKIFQHDINYSIPSEALRSCDAVVTEPYLGPPLLAPPSKEEALKQLQALAKLYKKFFNNVRPLLAANGWIVMIMPAIVSQDQGKRELRLLARSIIDEVESIGYSCKQLGAKSAGVVYARPDAIVAREITLWQKR